MMIVGTVLGGLLLVTGLFYAGVIGSYARGFRRIIDRANDLPSPTNGHWPFVSVIVPARDEEESIEACVRSILACGYPDDLFEVIVVDDLSHDATPAIVRQLIAEHAPIAVPAGLPHEADDQPEGQPLRLIQMPDELERRRAHKKRAISRGIEAARGEIILTTDADCRVPRGWIAEMTAAFEDDVALVSGPVLYPVEGNLAADVQALEFLGLIAVGAGAIGAGRPNLCNGANVAYRRDVFEEVGGFEGIDHLTSGDDELLMQKIAYTTQWSVRFCGTPGAAVETAGMRSIGDFVQQRRRWASKGSHYPHLPLRITIAGIYAFYVFLLGGIVLAVVGFMSPWIVAAGALLKVIPEAALLGQACLHFRQTRLLAYFLPAQPAHVLYIVGIGAAGALGGYTWKGRVIER